MRHFLYTIWQIALLRSGPQDLPGGVAAPVIAVAAHASIVVVASLADERAASFSGLFVSVVVPLVAVGAILGLRRMAARFNQTVAALFGTGALISLINIPLWFFDQTPLPTPLVMLALIALFWSLAVDGHVWRHALNCSFAGGVAVAVVVFFLQLLTIQVMGNPGVS